MIFKKKNINILETCDNLLTGEYKKQLGNLTKISLSLDTDWEKSFVSVMNAIFEVNKGRDALKNVREKETPKRLKKINPLKLIPKKDESSFQFIFSSLFLIECYLYLISDPNRNELIHMVTGIITPDGVRVPNKMEKMTIDKDTQSSVYVSTDKEQTHRQLVNLIKHDHQQQGLFHIHMSKGKASTTPSTTDFNCHARAAKIGTDYLAGIFSLDGYIRFFMHEKDCKISIYGKGVDKVCDEGHHNIFKINEEMIHASKNV